VYEDFVECLKLYDKQEDGTMLGAELTHILLSLGNYENYSLSSAPILNFSYLRPDTLEVWQTRSNLPLTPSSLEKRTLTRLHFCRKLKNFRRAITTRIRALNSLPSPSKSSLIAPVSV